MAANSGRRGRPSSNTQAAQEPNEDRWERMMQVIQEQTAVATNLVNSLAQISGPVQPPPPPSKAPNRLIYDFLKLKPQPFTGGHDPLEAQYWLDELNKIFEILQCTDEQKVTFAAYMLKGEANNWWNLARASVMAKGNPMNWEYFQEVFLGRYFPECMRQQKEREFIQLQQGGMSVAEYLTKFEELARFSCHYRYDPEGEKWKINRFMLGLRPDIRVNLVLHEFTSYSTLVHGSYIAEKAWKKIQEERQLKRQRVSLTNSPY